MVKVNTAKNINPDLCGLTGVVIKPAFHENDWFVKFQNIPVWIVLNNSEVSVVGRK